MNIYNKYKIVILMLILKTDFKKENVKETTYNQLEYQKNRYI